MATTKWSYVGIMQLPADVPQGVKDEWETTLKAQRASILANLQTKIPNQTAFQDRIADASSDRYEQFLATVGADFDRDLILLKQRAKLARQYTQWLADVQSAFAIGGAFDVNVTAKKNKLSLARYTLGAVGLKYDPTTGLGVWNPAVMSALLIRGDTRCARYFDANDTFTGTLESVVDTAKGRLISPPMIAETVRCRVLAKFADEAGLTTLRDNLITASNTRLDDIINAGLNATHKGVGYDVTWIMAWSAPDSDLKVTVTDTHP